MEQTKKNALKFLETAKRGLERGWMEIDYACWYIERAMAELNVVDQQGAASNERVINISTTTNRIMS